MGACIVDRLSCRQTSVKMSGAMGTRTPWRGKGNMLEVRRLSSSVVTRVCGELEICLSVLCDVTVLADATAAGGSTDLQSVTLGVCYVKLCWWYYESAGQAVGCDGYEKLPLALLRTDCGLAGMRAQGDDRPMLPPRASFRTTGMPRRRRAIGSVCAPCTSVTHRPARLACRP